MIAIAVEGEPLILDGAMSIKNHRISIGDIQLMTEQAVYWLGLPKEIFLERIATDWASWLMELEPAFIVD